MSCGDQYKLCGRLSYLKINLDAITNNIRIIQSRCSPHTGIIAVVKAGAYGHGSREVSKHLQSVGVQRLAVATSAEGALIRQAGVTIPIHVLGNSHEVEIPEMMKHNLIPTVCTEEFIKAWADSVDRLNISTYRHTARKENDVVPGSIDIKIDTGLSRNGVQVDKLAHLVQLCDALHVNIDGMFTHFAQSVDDPEFTAQQLDVFIGSTEPYKSRGINLHVANSGAIIRGCGTRLDYVRPGIAIYGLTPDNSFSEEFRMAGFQPALSWMAKPSMVKTLQPGSFVGYGKTYRCEIAQKVATFSIGYADGISRKFSSSWWISDIKGNLCPIIGRVNMDAITVRLTEEQSSHDEFFIITDDFNEVTSAIAWAKRLDTITYTVAGNLGVRLPRRYVCSGKKDVVITDLQNTF